MEDDVSLPPYLSYRTFKGFLEALGQAGVPNRIDRSQMSTMSGQNQKLTFAALRYLGLISPKGVSTPQLAELVTAEGPARERLWRSILEKAYPKLFEIDLERTTAEELSDIFKRLGVSSKNTIPKCITFFSHALKDAGTAVSPHVRPYKGARPITQTGQTKIKRDRESPTIDGNSGHPKTKWESLLGKVPDLDPTWSKEEIENWLFGIQGLDQIAGQDNTSSKSNHGKDESWKENET